MAGLAGGLPVRAHQREAGFLFMIKLGVGPGSLRVAVAAGSPALAAMHVVGRVAAGAGRGCCLPAIAGVAGRAGDLRMAGLQRKLRLRMVEVRLRPAGRLMAGGAVGTQLALVRLDLAMTVDALAGRVAEFLSGRMAAGAGDAAVCSIQLEVGLAVVEGGGQHRGDAAVPAQVFAVAGAALGAGDLRSPAMEAALLLQLRGDVLVAGRAALRLLGAIGAVVAAGAVGFKIGMRAGQRSGHEQALQRRGARGRPVRASEDADQCHTRPQASRNRIGRQ